MTKDEFRKLQEKVSIIINQAKKEDLAKGVDVTSDEYSKVLDFVKYGMIKKLGLDKEEYESLKKEFSRKVNYQDIKDTPVTFNADDIRSIARQEAKKIVKNV